MKIFISAYACEPYKGSEPGIGWNFVNEISKYHITHVLTRSNNRESIEKELEKKPNVNLTFYYYDLPKVLMFWKKKKRGYQLYYYLWQIFIYFKFKGYINKSNFDIVHHLTFGANWMPSLLMLTKSKTIFGPVGSEDIYQPILKSLPFKIRLKEFMRSNAKVLFYYFDPIRWLTILNADLILNHSSKYAKYTYPKFLQHKIQDHIQTGLNTKEEEYKSIKSLYKKPLNSPIRMIISSELVAWKGVVLSAEIFSKIAQTRDDVELVILGEGPQKNDMVRIFKSFDVVDKVIFKGFVTKKVLMQELYEADILLYPAYHHGLATIILQSMYAYLPIISMYGDIISDTIHNKCGLAAGGEDIETIKKCLIKNTLSLIDDIELRNKFALNGRTMIERTFEWNQLAKAMNVVYENIMEK